MKPNQIFAHWEQVRKDTIEIIDHFDENDLAYVPFTNSWPVGQIALHIADCEAYWLHDVVMHDPDPYSIFKFTEQTTKQAIIDILHQTHEKTLPFLNGLEEKNLDVLYTNSHNETFSLYWMIWHVIEHEIHHRGELSLMHGMLGRTGWDTQLQILELLREFQFDHSHASWMVISNFSQTFYACVNNGDELSKSDQVLQPEFGYA